MGNKIVEHYYGMVAENKPLSTNNILVSPSQRTPWLSGDMQSNVRSLSVETTDAQGNKVTASTNTDITHEATWLPTDSSWTTAPDVQRGEIVEIIRFADKNQYYWRERGDGIAKRRLETKRLMISGSSTAGDPSEATHYMVEVSGHKGSINISTPMANGEVASYLFTLSGKTGMASLSDDSGREIVMDSPNDIIRMRNKNGTLFELNEQDVGIYALGNVGWWQKGTADISAKTFFFRATEDINFIAGRNINFSANKGTVTTTANTIIENGVIQLNGPISQVSSSTGDFSANFKGQVNSEKDFVGKGISLVGHRHKGVQSGNDETNTPSAT